MEQVISPTPLKMSLTIPTQVPACPLPEGFSFRYYRKGDARTWAEIETSCGEFLNISEASEAFLNCFGANLGSLSQRMLFVTDREGRDCATVTAWNEAGCGQVHWVGVDKSHQGKGLCRPMISKVLQRLMELGYRDAFLLTSPKSWIAIRLYMQYGFRPVMESKEAEQGWELVNKLLVESGYSAI